MEQVCEVGGGLVIECSVCNDLYSMCDGESVQVMEDVGRVIDVWMY